MRLKSKSSIHIKKTQIENPEVKIDRKELEELYEKQGRLEILEDKVTRSRPILETIYEKIKRRQNIQEGQIKQLEKKVTQNAEALKNYKELYEESLRVMHRNNVVDKYQGHSNYPPNQNEESEEKISPRFDWKKIGKESGMTQRKGKIDQIKREYNLKEKPLTKEEIYLSYKRRLGEEQSEQTLLIDSPPKQSLMQRSRQLRRQFDNDIRRLGQFRPKGKSQYSQSQSSNPIDQYRLKQKYLKVQQEKLLKI